MGRAIVRVVGRVTGWINVRASIRITGRASFILFYFFNNWFY